MTCLTANVFASSYPCLMWKRTERNGNNQPKFRGNTQVKISLLMLLLVQKRSSENIPVLSTLFSAQTQPLWKKFTLSWAKPAQEVEIWSVEIRSVLAEEVWNLGEVSLCLGNCPFPAGIVWLQLGWVYILPSRKSLRHDRELGWFILVVKHSLMVCEMHFSA